MRCDCEWASANNNMSFRPKSLSCRRHAALCEWPINTASSLSTTVKHQLRPIIDVDSLSDYIQNVVKENGLSSTHHQPHLVPIINQTSLGPKCDDLCKSKWSAFWTRHSSQPDWSIERLDFRSRVAKLTHQMEDVWRPKLPVWQEIDESDAFKCHAKINICFITVMSDDQAKLENVNNFFLASEQFTYRIPNHCNHCIVQFVFKCTHLKTHDK